jgi:hypothetical protein
VVDSRFTFAGLWGVLLGNGATSATTLPTTSGDTAEIIKALALLVSSLGAVLLAWEQVRSRRGLRRDDDRPNIPPGVRSVLLGLVCLSAMLGSVGCKATPQTQVYAAEVAYVETLRVAVAVREAGWMDDATYRRVEAVRLVAAAALDAAKAKRLTGAPLDDTVIATLQAAVRQLAEAVREAHESRNTGGAAADPRRLDSGRGPDHGAHRQVREGEPRPHPQGVGGAGGVQVGRRVEVAGAGAQALTDPH